MNGNHVLRALAAGMAVRRRLRAFFSRAGRGVHTGSDALLTAAPAPWGTGLVFACPESVPVGLSWARAEAGSTILRAGSAVVRTPEHLLAALIGAGVTDAILHLEGPEVPILDGSAGPWWEAIGAVGVEDGPPIAPRVVRAHIEVALGGGTARLEPASEGEVVVRVGWGDPRLPSGQVSLSIAEFSAIAHARTFVLARDAAALRAAGRGRGADASNTLLVDPDAMPALRYADEIARHKALDAIGDLALAGAPFVGRLVVDRGSHALHQAALAAWRDSDPAAWAA
jgi:UDP-3-O-[3-hydroxymyristoyl] N-acetylglucosamine deacetylase